MTKQDDTIVLYRSYPDAVEASLVRGILQENGIPCFLSDEYMQSVYPVYAGLIGGVKLHLFERDRERADALLNDPDPEM